MRKLFLSYYGEHVLASMRYLEDLGIVAQFDGYDDEETADDNDIIEGPRYCFVETPRNSDMPLRRVVDCRMYWDYKLLPILKCQLIQSSGLKDRSSVPISGFKASGANLITAPILQLKEGWAIAKLFICSIFEIGLRVIGLVASEVFKEAAFSLDHGKQRILQIKELRERQLFNYTVIGEKRGASDINEYVKVPVKRRRRLNGTSLEINPICRVPNLIKGFCHTSSAEVCSIFRMFINIRANFFFQ